MRVARCEPRPIGVRVPLPVDHALDTLVDQLADVGVPTNRAELICALIAEAREHPRMAQRALSRYRRLNVAALLGVASDSGPVRLVKGSRGRPSGREERSTRWRTVEEGSSDE